MWDTSFLVLAHGTQSRVVMRSVQPLSQWQQHVNNGPFVLEITTKIGRMIIPLRYPLPSIFDWVGKTAN
jgi:hypothetical protein